MAWGLPVDAHRVPVPRPGPRDKLLMVPLSLRVGFSLCERSSAGCVKQTYLRLGAVSQLAAATTCGHVASGL